MGRSRLWCSDCASLTRNPSTSTSVCPNELPRIERSACVPGARWRRSIEESSRSASAQLRKGVGEPLTPTTSTEDPTPREVRARRLPSPHSCLSYWTLADSPDPSTLAAPHQYVRPPRRPFQ